MRRGNDQFTTILDTARLPSEQTTEQDFALVFNAPSGLAQALDDVRSRYDPAYKLGISPHITLKRPASLGQSGSIKAVGQVLREGLQGFGSFQVQLQGYGVFKNPTSNVLYLKVNDEQRFRELHEKAVFSLARLYPNGLADQYEGQNYHPHLTIANELSELDLSVLEHELTTSNFQLNFDFVLDNVILFVHQPGQPWEVAETIQL